MKIDKSYFQQAYRFFNRRDIDSLLAMMAEDVDWPNGWEGGYVHGPGEIRDYWTRQWSEIDPHVEPLEVEELPDGRYSVLVQQTVKDLAGKVMFDQQIRHVYTLKDGMIALMEILPV
ncbi:nuclear transport factor 2 family protein [Pollutibacter soli]|uniref:nuclear transport factor 2 family protein n=1 Tax=Pollutibacter soli TaxID=3034157 RepID=UPI00301326D6